MNAAAAPIAGPVSRAASIAAEARRLATAARKPRLERLSGVHNPWGHASTLTDAWGWLDICENERVLDEVERCIGPDIVLWDSQLYLDAAEYLRFLADGREGRYWPVEPLSGALAWVVPHGADGWRFDCVRLDNAAAQGPTQIDPSAWLYVVRYHPATSLFMRDPSFVAHRRAMEETPLVNHAPRPLWLVRGDDGADNDLVTGFAPVVPQWTGRSIKEK